MESKESINKKPENSKLIRRDSIKNTLDLFLNQGFVQHKRQSLFSVIVVAASLCLVGAIICCILFLQQFLRSLLWALLLGFVLHPFKCKITRVGIKWLTELDQRRMPLIIETARLPFSLINWFLNKITKNVLQYVRLLAFIFFALLLVHLSIYYFSFTNKILQGISCVCLFSYNLAICLREYTNIYIISTITVAHFILMSFFWNENNRDIIVYSTPIIWLSLLYKILSMLDALGIILLISLIVLSLGGFLASLFNYAGSENYASQASEEIRASMKRVASYCLKMFQIVWHGTLYLLPTGRGDESEDLLENDKEDKLSVTDFGGKIQNKQKADAQDNVSLKSSEISQTSASYSNLLFIFSESPKKKTKASHAYLYSLVWSCMLAQIYLRPQLLYLLPVSLSLFFFKWLIALVKESDLYLKYETLLINWIDKRKDAICNSFFRLIYEYMLISNHLISITFIGQIDTIASILVIFVMLFSIIFGTIFLSLQMYNESALLVEITGNILPTINSTLSKNPELSKIIPENFLKTNLLNEMMNNAYLHGREWLQKWIQSTLAEGQDSNSTQVMEKQLLEVWDRVYHIWINPIPGNDSDSQLNEQKIISIRTFEEYNWNKMFSALKTLNISLCIKWMKENFDVIFSVFESIWKVLKGNVSVLFSIITAIISILLSGSSAILNTSLSIIVFLTSLFYLLASSNEQYRPIEMAGRLIIHLTCSESRSILRFEKAVEDSIRSIFKATFKMSAFYGLYTWLLLTLFNMQVVYIPSVLAALFGAVPFIGPYWAFLPGILELWLIHSLNGKAFLLFVLALLPSYFVDTAIYSEIKGGGHPYLTGLAIAGGVLYMGFEGAFIGPLLLCCICVIINFYTSLDEE